MSGVHEAMAEVIKEVTAIAKVGSDNVSYTFRSVDHVLNALHKPLADNGLFLAPRILDDWQLNPIPGTNNRTQYQAAFRVEVVVWHSSGESVVLGPGLAQSHDYGDKAVYQAQQNAIKYLLLEAFAIPTDEPDMDSRQADDIPAQPQVEDHGAWLKTAVEAFSKWSEIEKRQAYKAVMEELSLDSVGSMADARSVFEGMAQAYTTEHPPAEGEAPF